ncbi:Ggct [Acrasis kona]|uniref:gamma-glutamylcyclotransferase n=1 Tax=Acrasis kona TaxID=1008807 RepID=A0AAW2YHK8_9EUKA
MSKAFCQEHPGHMWYLAYGSNMNSNTFKVRRKIKPFEFHPCTVAGYTLNFQMVGYPYMEPSFASVHKITEQEKDTAVELHGVVYRITTEDYIRIRKTEGGGGNDNAGYDDIDVLVKTYDGKNIWARTLIGHQDWVSNNNALPSLRYLELLRQGAKEHGISEQYQKYLLSLEHYDFRSIRQKIGRIIFLAIFLPIFMPLLLTLFYTTKLNKILEL